MPPLTLPPMRTFVEHRRGVPMAMAEKYIVLPFKRVRGGLAPRPAAMAPRHIGVAAYAVQVDMESGDMTSPRLLIQFGEIGELASSASIRAKGIGAARRPLWARSGHYPIREPGIADRFRASWPLIQVRFAQVIAANAACRFSPSQGAGRASPWVGGSPSSRLCAAPARDNRRAHRSRRNARPTVP